jgi:CP family cyanate transporter-like MFS transporter
MVATPMMRLSALLLISLSLRPVLASVPPLTLEIQATLGWSDTLIGVLTTIPVACMALFALVVPRLLRRVTIASLSAIALLFISVSLAMRWWAEFASWVLLTSALLAGIGIALGAGVTPSLVRTWFPNRIAIVSSQTTATFMGGAGLASALSVPLAVWWGSWAAALTLWTIPAIAGLVVWSVIAVREKPEPVRAVVHMRVPWGDPIAWALALFLGVNSVVFYVLLAWMAPSYDDRGWTEVEGGYLLGFLNLVQVAGALVLPRVLVRVRDRRPIFVTLVIFSTAALLLMGVAPATLSWLVIAVVGIGLGGAFAVGLALLAELAQDSGDAAGLTAMSMFIAYSLAACGPFLGGLLLDAQAGWVALYVIVAAFSLAQLIGIVPLRRAAQLHPV